MAQMTLTSEQQTLLATETEPVMIVNNRGVPTHVAMPIEEARRVYDEYLRRELGAAFKEASQLPLEPWDIEATIAEAHRRYANS